MKYAICTSIKRTLCTQINGSSFLTMISPLPCPDTFFHNHRHAYLLSRHLVMTNFFRIILIFIICCVEITKAPLLADTYSSSLAILLLWQSNTNWFKSSHWSEDWTSISFWDCTQIIRHKTWERKSHKNRFFHKSRTDGRSHCTGLCGHMWRRKVMTGFQSCAFQVCMVTHNLHQEAQALVKGLNAVSKGT